MKKAGAKVSGSEAQRIDELKELARELKESKKLTAANEDERRRLEDLLFIEQIQFKLQEESNELIGKPLDITFQFLRAGFVVIQCNDERFVYENKRITGGIKRNPQTGDMDFAYQSGLPKNCFITVQSNGGQWRLAYGHPRYKEAATVWSQPFDIDFDWSDGELRTSWEGDASMPGCSIEVALAELEAPQGGNVPKLGRYQLVVDLLSDGRYTPELYNAYFHIAAGTVAAFGAPVWDSQAPGNPDSNSKNHIVDVTIQDDKERAKECTVHVHNTGDIDVDLPLNIGALACDIQLRDEQTAQTIALAKMNKVVVNPTTNVNDFDLASNGFATIDGAGSMTAFSAAGAQSWLDVELRAAFPFNGEFPNDCLRRLFRDAGMPESLYSRIGAGNIGIRRISLARPGRYPDRMPAAGIRIWEVARDLVKRDCPHRQLIVDALGFNLVSVGARDRADLAYDVPPAVDVRSPLCLRELAPHEGLKLTQDVSEFITGVTVIGAKNPLTGERFTWTETIPQAYVTGFEDSLFWIGEERHLTLEVNDSLKSVTRCIQVARETLNITPLTPVGLLPWVLEVRADYEATMRTGDLIRVKGLKFLVEEVDFASLNAGTDAQRRKFRVRLAEDRLVSGVSI